jgi:hypothetical protein
MLKIFIFIFLIVLLDQFDLIQSFLSYNVKKSYGERLMLYDQQKQNILEKISRATPPKLVVVIKYGGHAMENDEFKSLFCEDIAALCRVCKFNHKN